MHIFPARRCHPLSGGRMLDVRLWCVAPNIYWQAAIQRNDNIINANVQNNGRS